MTGEIMVLLAGIGNDAAAAPSSAPSDIPYELSASGNVFQLIGLVLLLILILAAAFFTSRYIGKLSLGQLKNSNFKIIDTYRISPNKFLQIIKVANKFILISVSKDTVNFISELDEAEVLIKEFHTKENLNFKQILDKLKNKTD